MSYRVIQGFDDRVLRFQLVLHRFSSFCIGFLSLGAQALRVPFVACCVLLWVPVYDHTFRISRFWLSDSEVLIRLRGVGLQGY